ncbi:unnamed protein product [Aureobasidium pullulans]|nr:unnamed protein product [Aureobasidium pullulans]
MYRAVRFLFPFLFSPTFCFPILVLHYSATVKSLPNITKPFESHTYFIPTVWTAWDKSSAEHKEAGVARLLEERRIAEQAAQARKDEIKNSAA